MKSPRVRMMNGSQEKFPSRQASSPAMTQEYTVTMVTAERVAISHLETTSSASHSFLSSIFINCQEAFRHMGKLMCISLSSAYENTAVPYGREPAGIIQPFCELKHLCPNEGDEGDGSCRI